jgi:multiple sugar transport system permease protein
MGGLVMTTATSAPVRAGAAPPRWRRLLRFEGRLMAPGILLLAPLSLLPFVFIVVMSLSHVHLLGGVRFDFAGLVNWARVFTDPDVGMAWVRSFGYFVLTVGLEMGLGLVFALCLWRLLRGRTTVLSLRCSSGCSAASSPTRPSASTRGGCAISASTPMCWAPRAARSPRWC